MNKFIHQYQIHTDTLNEKHEMGRIIFFDTIHTHTHSHTVTYIQTNMHFLFHKNCKK